MHAKPSKERWNSAAVLTYHTLLTFALVTFVALPVLAPGAQAKEPGFREVVKNPELMGDLDEFHEELDKAIAKARKWDPEAVGRVVSHFVFEAKSDDEEWERRILIALGIKLHPHLLTILKDESLRGRLLEPAGKGISPEAPFNRLCDLYDPVAPPEAVLALSSFVEDNSEGIRKDVALVLGGTGTAQTIAPLQKALADADEYVRSYALMGLQRAMERGALAPQCKKELYDDVARLLKGGKNAYYASDVLLNFDEKRAAEFLLSPAVFTPDCDSLYRALDALSKRKLPALREKLLDLIRQLESKPLEYPRTYALGSALHMLGLHHHPDDEQFLTRKLACKEEESAEGAAAGLLSWHKLDEFHERLDQKEAATGFASLTAPQQHWSAVFMFDAEVNNGGLSQYFFNSAGEHWQQALAGLDAIGAKERAQVLREAIAQFGKTPPSTKRDARQHQLAKLARKNDEHFSALETRYYASKESIEVLSTLYVLKQPDAFK